MMRMSKIASKNETVAKQYYLSVQTLLFWCDVRHYDDHKNGVYIPSS